MTANDESTKLPANDETPVTTENTDVKPAAPKPADRKEQDRQRSKDDLARKRRNMRGGHGKL